MASTNSWIVNLAASPAVSDIPVASWMMGRACRPSYGVEPNRHVLSRFLARHHAEGLSSRLLGPEELFHPA
ncbi:MAG TPA: hypothetical protein VFK01_10830 [Bradyrhizobium sp.]|nr:hypothetical protein [Bradyrhizobium sp.]